MLTNLCIHNLSDLTSSGSASPIDASDDKELVIHAIKELAPACPGRTNVLILL